MRRLARAAVRLAFLAAPRLLAGQERGAAALGHAVDALGTTARVLVVGAHPDDEDTRLIAWLAKGRHAETAYLSLTRGDGGQNLIGNELGEALGAIRTEELLAARRLDGGRQYFTRAYDFGFSKTAEETLRHWPHDAVLGDVVRTVRAFRPDVVISIWSGTPADGHGHHQLAGILAREAWDAAADTARFPAREYGAAWAVPKFYRATSYRGHGGATLRYDAGAYDPLLGRSYAELAAISRSEHKSQGQGGLERKGVSIVSLRREATRVNADVPAEREGDLFAGIDTTVAGALRGAGCTRPGAPDSVAAGIDAVRAAFDARRPGALVAPLDRLSAALAPCLGTDPADVLHRRLAEAWALAVGVAVEAEVAREVVAIGDTATARVTLFNRGPFALHARLGTTDVADPRSGAPVAPDSSTTWTVPVGDGRVARGIAPDRDPAVPTQPWWLVAPRDGDMFASTAGVGRDETTDAFAIPVWVSVDAARSRGFLVHAPVVYRVADPVKGDVRRPLATAPAVSVTLEHAVAYARAGAPLDRVIAVRLRSAATAPRTVAVRLALPPGLAADSAVRTVTLPRHGAEATVDFRVRGTLPPGRHVVRAVAESGGERFATGYEIVDYEHIAPQRLYRRAETAMEAVDVVVPGQLRVGYVPGVSDNVAPALAQLGIPITVLDPAALGATDLSRFTAIVVGPRAYGASDALVAHNARLLDWTRAGGTLVVQYGQYELTQPGIMPYPITLGRPAQRVTIEEAPVERLEPLAPVLVAPNRIGPADLAGWVQERALYMPGDFDPRYRPALAMADPGEPTNRGAVLVAPLGRGTYVYTSLSLFRQLPAGNPGAARLFVNLLAARAAPTVSK